MPALRFPGRLSFRLGLVFGALIGAVSLALMLALGKASERELGVEADAHVEIGGAKLSALGVQKTVLRHDYETITLTCRDVCDDLRVRDTEAPYGGYGLSLLDANGAAMPLQRGQAPRGSHDLTSFAGGGVAMWTTPPAE